MRQCELTELERAILSRLLVIGPTSARELARSLDLGTRIVLAYLWQLRRYGWVEESGPWWKLSRRARTAP